MALPPPMPVAVQTLLFQALLPTSSLLKQQEPSWPKWSAGKALLYPLGYPKELTELGVRHPLKWELLGGKSSKAS